MLSVAQSLTCLKLLRHHGIAALQNVNALKGIEFQAVIKPSGI